MAPEFDAMRGPPNVQPGRHDLVSPDEVARQKQLFMSKSGVGASAATWQCSGVRMRRLATKLLVNKAA
jgi:hypothetical protein